MTSRPGEGTNSIHLGMKMNTLKLKSNFVLALGLACIGTPATSFAGIQIGTPMLSGNGCSRTTAGIAVSPDGQALSVLFDAFTAQVGGSSGTRMTRTSCILNIPVSAPAGTQVAISQADFRAYNQLADRAYAQYTTQYSMAGQVMPMILRRIVGPVNSDFESINRLRQQDIKWGPCGGTTSLSINTSVVVQANGQNAPSMATIDSVDLRGGPSDKALEFHLLYRSCAR